MYRLSAIELRDKFLHGDITAVSIVDYYLKRIEKYDPQIGSFLRVYKDRAHKQAEILDKKRTGNTPLGKLAGIPISIKDNILVKGDLTTCASRFLSNYTAPFDAMVIRLLEAEDAILIGKTNMDEFAMGSSTENSAFQKTYNPWNLKCSPGGSSGGSAAAVAGRLSPISLGSDTGGSVRQPAAFCGVVGFKPTYGRVSRSGLVAYGSSLDQIGPIATTVRDAALVMEVLGRHCPMDATSIPKGPEDYLNHFNGSVKKMTIGVPWHFLENLAEEPKKLFNDSIALLKSLGARIVDVDLSLLKYSIATYYIVATAEASTNLARYDGVKYGQRSPRAQTLEEVYEQSREDGFGPEVKRRILLGTFVLSSGFQEAFYRKAQKVRTLIMREYIKAFTQCDLIATPVSPSEAFEIGAFKNPMQMYLEDIYTIGINLAGLPAVSIPNGFTKTGKPNGLQLIGPQSEDLRVLQIAHILEKATPAYSAIPEWVKEVS